MKSMKGGLTFIEIMIIVAIIGLIIAIAVPSFVKQRQSNEIKNVVSLAEQNDLLLKHHSVAKLFELNGFNVYVFRDNGGNIHSIAIPATNSVYDLERK